MLEKASCRCDNPRQWPHLGTTATDSFVSPTALPSATVPPQFRNTRILDKLNELERGGAFQILSLLLNEDVKKRM
jgi:hypothetical protein